MDSLEDKVAIVTGEHSGPGVVVARHNKRKVIGLLLCLGAAVVGAAGWAWALSSGETSTDNAYVRGDVTSLAPKVAGYVTAVEVEDNQTVRAGDVLFRIDDRDYRARLAQAVANVDAAQARLSSVDAEIRLQHALVRQAEAQKLSTVAELSLAARASDRRRELVRSNAVSQAQVDESDAARLRAEAGVSAASATIEAQQQRIAVLETQREAAIAAVAQARAARDLAQIDLDSTVVRAPVSGVVGNRQVRIGRLVAPGTSLLDLVPVDVWVVANFKETQIEHIQAGQRVRVTIDGYPNVKFEGVVDSFAPGSGSAFSLLPADNATGNFVRVVQRVPVKIRLIGNPLPGRLVPGLSARIEVVRGSGAGRTKSPDEARGRHDGSAETKEPEQ
ncbi:HlyD family secretion protein [Allomesorhizobium camelthorni]|uniref:HlyD family secretion protein n=1 Tax=Allomesorhizobium camelthorni TaxID=475069 RepID=A0A6G4W942_9HYPH|nr:HlyD family secretion protein [Mesorhizobium camelthorni]NGO51084.1 HlyD family secretion protein [Mesorhizobium camelthorni]